MTRYSVAADGATVQKANEFASIAPQGSLAVHGCLAQPRRRAAAPRSLMSRFTLRLRLIDRIHDSHLVLAPIRLPWLFERREGGRPERLDGFAT